MTRNRHEVRLESARSGAIINFYFWRSHRGKLPESVAFGRPEHAARRSKAAATPQRRPFLNLANGRLFQEEIESLEELSRFQPIWVDLESPTLEEKRWIKQYFGLSIPEDAMDEDIEESARFYEEDNGELHIRSDFLIADEDEPRTVRCAFILNQHNANLKSQGVLFSIHDEDVPVFRLLRMRARRAPGLIEDAKEVLLKLFDADAEYSADTLEGIYDKLETAGKKVLSGDVTDAMAGEVLGAIARQEDLNGRIRRNVMDTRRAVSFMMRSKMLNAEQFEEARQILRDIDSLDSHTAFLFDKINFLMDATVGFININQNKIIKIFSVASVALLPPTLIASIYGMNFQYMPELNQTWGYPMAIALMAASAVVPMWYFRRRGWLK
jgi:magnesium transporter